MTAWLQITSGQGPAECCWVVGRVLDQIVLEAPGCGCQVHLLEAVEGEHSGTFRSALLAVEGEDLSKFLAQWEGTIQWIGRSVYRPNHRRRNWFVGVTSFLPPDPQVVDPREIRIDVMRSSGPGGQHANKTSSAVRATHVPTGLVATAQEERSQHLNRQLAVSRLLDKLHQANSKAHERLQKDRWSCHADLERGNPVRVYQGDDFRPKKD